MLLHAWDACSLAQQPGPPRVQQDGATDRGYTFCVSLVESSSILLQHWHPSLLCNESWRPHPCNEGISQVLCHRACLPQSWTGFEHRSLGACRTSCAQRMRTCRSGRGRAGSLWRGCTRLRSRAWRTASTSCSWGSATGGLPEFLMANLKDRLVVWVERWVSRHLTAGGHQSRRGQGRGRAQHVGVLSSYS